MRQRKREREPATHDNQTYDSTCEHDQELSLSVLRDPKVNTQKSLVAANEKLQNDPAIDILIRSMFEEVEESDMANY